MKKKRLGFTLLELIIVVALTVIILGITSSMFITGNKVFSDSDVKFTLQMEGQVIQEKISNIGMEATGIQSVNWDSAPNEINEIVINSYDENGSPYNFKIQKNDLKKTYKDKSEMYELWIDDKLVSSNIKSIKIINDITNADGTLKNINSIEFAILLRKEKGFSDAEQPINFTVTFRNKGN